MTLGWKDNRGFTLVELVISMAIMSIVAGTVGILMVQGSKGYRNAKSELDLQMESQTVMAQLNTMIMESNMVNYDPVNQVMTLYQIETLPATAGAVSIPTKVRNVKFIQYKNEKLYLYEHDHDQIKPASGGSVSCSGCGKYTSDGLLAEYIESFSVTPEGDLNKDCKTVTIHLGMKNGIKKYDADVTTKIRNKLIAYP